MSVPICADLDGDCEDLDHLHCWLYDPIRGRCPYLSSTEPEKHLKDGKTLAKAHTAPAPSPSADTIGT